MWLLTALGIDPLSALGKILLGFLTILPYILVVGLLVGTYFYGHSRGFADANIGYYQSEIKSKDKVITDLKKQYQDEVAAYNKLDASKTAQNNKGSDAKKVITKIIKQCDQDQSLVDELNKVRQ
jgi:hypothetical protein